MILLYNILYQTTCSMKKLALAGLLCILPFLSAEAVQLLPKPTVNKSQSTDSINTDPLGRSTPRGTVSGFFKSLANEDYIRASQYINLPESFEKPNDSALVTLIQKFEVILNKNGYILPVSIINNTPEGDENDGLTSKAEQTGTLDLNGKSTPILLERIYDTAKSTIWLISSETAQTLLNHIEANPESYSAKLQAKNGVFSKWRGAPITEWLSIIALAIGSYFLAWLVTLFIRWVVRTFWRSFEQNRYSNLLRALLVPLRLVLAVTILVNSYKIVELSIIVRQGFGVVNLIALWTALFIFIWLLINTLSSIAEDRLRDRNIVEGLSAMSFLKNSAKFTLIAIAILIVFDTLGYNITAGIAALGVGGIALALGAQKTVENVIGGLSVIFDQPVSVGDFCKFGDTIGTVEKIGMRSTRIRTLGRTLVTIPNADFSSQLIENFAKRDMFLYLTTLGLRYETTSDQMRYILVELRKILYAHPKVNPDPARVRFLGYGSDSLKVELFAYIHAVDWNDFLGIQEDINLKLAKVIEDSGSGFAFPSQTLYISQDQGLSDEKKAEAEAKVKEWIANNELNIPNFDNQTIENLKGSIPYPPEGSKKPL
jgi:MscS family membrane protein